MEAYESDSIMPHVRVLRFIAQLRREFLVTLVNPRDVARQDRQIASLIRRNRPEENFVESDAKTGESAPDSTNHAITSRGGIPFVGVHRRDRVRNLRPAENHVRQAATEFTRRAIIV